MSTYPKAVAEGWHPIATSAELGRTPLSRRLMGRPLVVFRGTNAAPSVLIDRCPHRNVALSRGRIRDGAIECPYHGWQFSTDGQCVHVPGAATPWAGRAEALPAIEHAGAVWTTFGNSPFAALGFNYADDRVFDTFWWAVDPSRANLVDAVENLLDPAHPHFIHNGLVRSAQASRRPVEVTVTVGPESAEASYLENSRPNALVPRLFEGLRRKSLGRFFPPATGQVSFEGPKGVKLAITVFFVPESIESVRPFAHFATPKGVAPAMLKRWVLKFANGFILRQDRAVLVHQRENVAAFGATRYVVGPLDFLFAAIRALANGEHPEPTETHTTIYL